VAYNVPSGDFPRPENGDLDRSVGEEFADRIAKALAAEGLSPRRQLAIAATTGDEASGRTSAMRATGMLIGALTADTGETPERV
jgi:hypothetical protein